MKRLNSLGVSVFCENLAMMLSAGIPADGAMELLAQDAQKGVFCDATKAVEREMLEGATLGEALQKSQCFPDYAVNMVQAGELAGRTEDVLRNLSVYYDAQSRLESKLKSAVVYPAVFLLVMAGILLLLVTTVLPIFTGVYTSLVGDLAASSYSYVSIAYVVGYCALAVTITLVLLLLAVDICSKSLGGRAFLSRVFQKLPFTSGTSYAVALSQFMTALATFVASGVDSDTALREAMAMVEHRQMQQKLNSCRTQMEDGQSLAQAFQKEKLFDSLYTRMLVSGAHSGQTENVLAQLARLFSEDTDRRINRLIDFIEPALAIFLTVSVGLTLISVMLPLIGILGAIG